MSTPEAESLLSRLGVPKLAGNGKFATATGIDSIGTGLILAFTVVYFVKTTTVPLADIGVAMTVARLLALPVSMLVGPMIDRLTARITAVGGNLISAFAYTAFLFAHQTWSIVLVVFLVQVGHTSYWTSSGALIALAAPQEIRTRWFGFSYALRNAGMGVGSAVGAFAFALGNVGGLYFITIANAASFVLAATLLLLWRPTPNSDAKPAEAKPVSAAAGYATVLRDHRYTTLIGVNVTLVFAQMLIKVLLAVYIVAALHKGAWIAGTLIVVTTIQISLSQTVINRRMERYRPTRVIMGAAGLNAAAFGLFAFLDVAPNWLVIGGLVVAMLVFTLGEIIAFPAIDNLSVAMAPEQIRGRYLAVYQLSWTVGEIVAPGLLTVLLAAGATLPMFFLLVLSLLALPLLLVLERGAARTGDHAATSVSAPAAQA